MNSIDKLLQDLRAAKGIAPDPLVDEVQPKTLLPGEIDSPDVLPDEVDAELAGISVPPATPDDLLAAVPPPDATVAPVAPLQPDPGLGQLASLSAGTSQSVASGSQEADRLEKYRKYETGTGDQLSAEMAAIDASKNPEAEAGSQSMAEADETMAGVVSNQAEQAGLARMEADEAQAIHAQEAAEVQAYQADLEQSYAEGLNRIDEADREVADIAAREPDPGRYWSTRTAGQKAAFLLTAALQAFAKPNESPKIVDLVIKFIDDDVKIQEDRLGRELAAAQGRGKSVREIIAMGKDKDTAVYGQKMLAIAGLEKSLATKMRGLGAGAAAEAQILAAKQAMDAVKARYRENAAAGARSNAQIEAARLEGARQRAAASQARKDARRWELEDQAREDAKEAKAAAAAGTPQVNVAGMTGGIGERGDGIIPNPIDPKGFGAKLAKAAEGYEAAAKTVSEGMAIVERMQREGKSPQLDSEWNAWVVRAQPALARSAGHTGVLTQADVESSVAGSGYQVVGKDGYISTEFLRNVRTNPATAMRFLETLDSAAATKQDATIGALADPNQKGIRAITAREYRDQAIAKEQAHATAAKDDRGMAMAGISRGGGTDYEKSYRKTAELLPFPGAKNVPAERAMQEVASQGRGNAATGETLTALYDAKSSLESAAKSAKSTADKVDLGIRLKRAEAGIYVIENTPEKTTPKQYAAELRRQAKFERGKLDMAKGGMGIGPTSKERVAELEKAADAYEAALKLATGVRN